MSIESCQSQLYPHWQLVNTREEARQVPTDWQFDTLFYLAVRWDRLNEKALYACAAALNAGRLIAIWSISMKTNGLPKGTDKAVLQAVIGSPELFLEAINYVGPAACFRLSKAMDALSMRHWAYMISFCASWSTLPAFDMFGKCFTIVEINLSSPVSIEQIAEDVQALEGRLQRTGRHATVTPNIPNHACYDVHVTLGSEPLVSIIIPTAAKVVTHEGRQIDLIVNCIEQILARCNVQAS